MAAVVHLTFADASAREAGMFRGWSQRSAAAGAELIPPSAETNDPRPLTLNQVQN